MFLRGRKLVAIVNQNDESRVLQDVPSNVAVSKVSHGPDSTVTGSVKSKPKAISAANDYESQQENSRQNDESRVLQDVPPNIAVSNVSHGPDSTDIVKSKPKATSAAKDYESQQENSSVGTDAGFVPTPSHLAITNTVHEPTSCSVTFPSAKSNAKRKLFLESPPLLSHQDLATSSDETEQNEVTTNTANILRLGTPLTVPPVNVNSNQNNSSNLAVLTSNTNVEYDVVAPGQLDSRDHANKIDSPSLLVEDGIDMLPQSHIPTVSNKNGSNQVSPKPGTSKENHHYADFLHQDLYLSDSSNNTTCPYIDSESSYCPTPPPSRSRRLLSLDREFSDFSDTSPPQTPAEVLNENVPKKRKKAMPETWKKNVIKRLRQTGQGYISKRGKYMEPKACKPTDCSKCRYKCNVMFPEYLRQDIFEEYWKLGNTKQQKQMLSSLIIHGDVLRVCTKAKKNRSMSRSYWLFHQSIGKHRVCQKFFCNTFDISTSIINICSKNYGVAGSYVGTDNRKGKIPTNITSPEATKFVKEHIDQYPRIESHYCRKDSKKIYLDSDLNLSRMYKMYKEMFCPEKQITPVSPYVYHRIFHSYEPKLAFYKPKKDQCTKCNVYKRSNEKASLQEEYDAHKKREKDSLDMKKEDKERCLNTDGAFRAITFDLQAVLSIPFTGDCKIYYLRKLSLYNLTILDCHENTGLCYLWDECNGKKGSTEIGSILFKYLNSLPENVTHVSSFSDTCGGQNRNKYVTLIALYAVHNISHLDTIDLKFMESGHSYLEADSMHACIERFRKHKSIFTVREYALIMGSARIKPKHYDVLIMKHDDFYDIKAFEKTLNTNTTKNIKNETVQWLKIKWLRVNKESPTSIFYKYDLNDPDFEEINICKAKNAGKKRDFINKFKKNLKRAYKSVLPISQCKKKDLLTLLKDGVIPSDYDQYYRDLPSSAASIPNINITDTETSDDEEVNQDDFNIEEI